MEVWRRLPYHVGRSDLHFALSDALVRLSESPTIWWHSTQQPTLILGASQISFNLDACERAGVLVVKRQAGGTAILASSGVLGLDVMLPTGHRLASADVVEAYRWLGEVWAASLARTGIETRLVSVADARAAAREPRNEVLRLACFGSISPYEVVSGGRKLVGLAQVRRRTGMLLQSAIHLHFAAEELAGLLSNSDRTEITSQLRTAAVGLDELSPRPIAETEIMTTFEQTLMAELSVRLEADTWSEKELKQAGPMCEQARPPFE